MAADQEQSSLSDELPPPPKGWELHDADMGQDQEEEEVRALSLPPFPLWVHRIFRSFRHKGSSARDEWLAYYQGRYSSRSPDLALFKKLLARNGCWDIPSPFVPGSRQAAEFCQAGVFLADVVFLLDRWSSHVMEQGFSFYDTGSTDLLSGEDEKNPYMNEGVVSPADTTYPLSSDSFSPIHRHIAMQSRAEACRNRDDAVIAAHCLSSLFLDHPRQWQWISTHLHVDNRVLLCKILHDSVSPSIQEKLRIAWVAAGWLSDTASRRLG